MFTPRNRLLRCGWCGSEYSKSVALPVPPRSHKRKEKPSGSSAWALRLGTSP
jgi:hypothetical protein